MVKNAKLIPANIDRLDLSERVLENWEQMLTFGATPVENLRLIENEIVILEGLVERDPERVAEMIRRYRDFAEALRKAIH